ncbi:MAG: dockerin type I repeat-containing protein [Muribaculaceae bacterium]|nr:dockerin type I repeat-containing protein [Muribaculaceae bacterium]
MKKITTLIFACFMAMFLSLATAVTTSDYVIDEGILSGDVNGDGEVTAADVTALYDVLLNNNYSNVVYGDQTGDNDITAADVTAVYNILLNGGGGHIGGSNLWTLDFIDNNVGSYSPDNYKHQWADGDVIFLAVDGDSENVYALQRTGGKWVFKDVQGSNKQGFKTSGGKVGGIYVQNADLSKCYVDWIPTTHDVRYTYADVDYTLTPRNGKFYITISEMFFRPLVSRINVHGAYDGDYFYGSVDHIDAVKKVTSQAVPLDEYYQISHKASLIDIDSNRDGSAYGVWKKDTYANGWLTLNYAKNNGYCSFDNYGTNQLYRGRDITIYSPWVNTWNRDLSMRYYNGDDRTSYRLNAGSTYQNLTINVGTNIILRPYNGDNTDTQGTMTSVTSSNSGILDISYDNTQVSVTAHKVGTTTLTIKFKTKDNINCTYTYEVKVEPTVWIAGSIDDKPRLWRNHQDRTSTLRTNLSSVYDNCTAATRVVVHGNDATVMMRKDLYGSKSYPREVEGTTYLDEYWFYGGGTAAIARATNANNGGYFNSYKTGIAGSYHRVSQYFPFNGVPLMWRDKNGNYYYTSASRSTNSDVEGSDNGSVVNTTIYKNSTALLTIPNFAITDLVVSESTGKIYAIGNSTNSKNVVSSLAVITGSTPVYYPITPSGNRYFIFGKMFLDQTSETVYIETITGNTSGINTQTSFIYRYTPSTGLTLYTDVDMHSYTRYNFMVHSTYFYGKSAVAEDMHNKPFIFYGNKFYYSKYTNGQQNINNKIFTYQLGASVTEEYTALASSTRVVSFDVKNGMIGMVVYNSNNKCFSLMTSELNSYRDDTPLENSNRAHIYDVWLQTSLDD